MMVAVRIALWVAPGVLAFSLPRASWWPQTGVDRAKGRRGRGELPT